MADRDTVGSQLKSMTDELSVMRADLGAVNSADVRSLALERDDLRSEVERLRNRQRDSDAKRSDRETLITQLEKRVLELAPLQAERDSAAQKLKVYEVDLGAVRDDRDALSMKLTQQTSELVGARTELAQLRQQLEKSDSDLQVACAGREQLSQQLALCKNDLLQAQADHRHQSDERQNALETVERLTQTLAERDLAIRDQIDLYVGERESNRKASELAERNHNEERQRLTTELDAVRDRNQQLQAAAAIHGILMHATPEFPPGTRDRSNRA